MSSLALELVNKLVEHWEFTELWIDPTASPPYTLVLLSDRAGNTDVYDPAQNDQVVFSSPTDEEARLWLLEDEYERVNGRFSAEQAA